MPLNLSITPNSRVPYKVVYEDHHLLALYKPAGIVTQPGQKHPHDSLLNGAFVQWGKSLQNLGKKRDFGLLHRLDRGTSGVLVVGLGSGELKVVDAATGELIHVLREHTQEINCVHVLGDGVLG